MERGVNLFGYIRAELGVGESCRLVANSLETLKIPFGVINYPICAARQQDFTWTHKEIKKPFYNTNLFNINADQLIFAYRNNLINRDFFKGKYNIALWHWELPEFPNEFIESFKIVNEVWVPSTFILKSILKKSPVPVKLIPHGIKTSVFPAYFDRTYFQLPNKQFLFLTMYDPNSGTVRKNPQAAVKAFQLAFGNKDLSVGLVIKINNHLIDVSAEIENLQKIIGNYENIHIINRVLNPHEVNALMDITDCLVSLHRSEGFGLPIAEAMISEKPVIATGWSGNMDFMNEENSCSVRFHLTNISQDWGSYRTNQVWAEPDIENAAYYMKKIITNPPWRNEVAVKGRETIKKYFSPEKSGDLMKERLTELKLL